MTIITYKMQEKRIKCGLHSSLLSAQCGNSPRYRSAALEEPRPAIDADVPRHGNVGAPADH